MPRRDESSGFPQVSSMPSIRKNRSLTSNWKNQRSNEVENLRKISSTANPFGSNLKKSFVPISMSTMRSGAESDDDEYENEAQDQITGWI